MNSYSVTDIVDVLPFVGKNRFHFYGGFESAVRIAEYGHDAIAHYLVQFAVIDYDGRIHLGKIRIKNFYDIERLKVFGQVCEIPYIAKEDGKFLFFGSKKGRVFTSK